MAYPIVCGSAEPGPFRRDFDGWAVWVSECGDVYVGNIGPDGSIDLDSAYSVAHSPTQLDQLIEALTEARKVVPS